VKRAVLSYRPFPSHLASSVESNEDTTVPCVLALKVVLMIVLGNHVLYWSLTRTVIDHPSLDLITALYTPLTALYTILPNVSISYRYSIITTSRSSDPICTGDQF
jgi:hypothetical protein